MRVGFWKALVDTQGLARHVTAPPASLIIRAPVAADRADWARLWTGYLAFYDTVLPPAQFDLQFSRLLSDDPRAYRGFMAFHDGAAVGLTHYVIHPHGWRPQHTCYLQDLWTEPTARGQGVARALIAAVRRAAHASGASNVYWLTQTGNTTARALYDKVAQDTGFVKYEVPAAGDAT
jgi:GNAT superfamily N-acetyltransferase